MRRSVWEHETICGETASKSLRVARMLLCFVQGEAPGRSNKSRPPTREAAAAGRAAPRRGAPHGETEKQQLRLQQRHAAPPHPQRRGHLHAGRLATRSARDATPAAMEASEIGLDFRG